MSSSLPDDRVAASSQPPSSSISSSSSPNSMVAAAQPSISPNPRTAFGLVRGVDPDSRASYSQLLAMADHDAAPQRRAAIVPHQITATPADALFDAIAPPFTSSAHSLLPSVSGAFTISQQQNTEHVADQVRWLDSQIHSQPLYSSCMSSAATTSVIHSLTSSGSMVGAENMQILSLDTKASESGFNGRPNSEQGSNSAPYYVDKPCDDGYNWRKYGQKHVKGSEYPRSYYKCTYRDCLVKKMVERSLDGQITEIIYKGQHNHEQPSSTRRSKDTNIFQQESNRLFGVIDKASQFRDGKLRTSGGAHNLLHGRVEETNQANLGCCNDEGKIDGEIRTNYQYNHEPDQKRSRIADTGGIGPVSSQRTVSEPKVVVQTRSEVDLLDDGYRWRKYGQKVVKGSSHPRSYYKCTYAGCSVRKHIERASTDPRSVITTYEGKHNHDVPTPRNSNHNHAASSKSFPGRPEYESINQLSTMGSLRMKEQGIN